MAAKQCCPEYVHAAVTWQQVSKSAQGEGRDGVKQLLEQKGLIQITDMEAIGKIVDNVLSQNQQQLQQYCAGKTKLQGFFVGQAPTPATTCISGVPAC